MRYGAMNSPFLPVLDEIAVFADMGFDYLELTMDSPCARYTDILCQKNDITNALKSNEMELVCHLPTFVYTADLTESIRKASLDEMCHSLEAASELGAIKTVLHPSMISGLGRFMTDTVKKLAMEAFEIIVNRADKLGICLCIENMLSPYGYYYEPEEFAILFRQFPQTMLNLDVGHAHIDCYGIERILDFIKTLGYLIGHIHVSDNFGQDDDHLPIGGAVIDFPKVIKEIKKIGYNDTITLEIFTEDRKDLKKSLKLFSDIVDSDS
ncbi:sugar phosphate isomerase/epimerase family protein [Desulfobacterales bacterium HSG16]|nr:sugar phosphate isomerase/epimerase family protein [Desulfobacterales bacterium HSG16]